MTYAIISDIHAHGWSAFAKVNSDGVNSRLRIILDEWKRAAVTLKSAGGSTMVVAGDIFHVRGSLDPEVLNPVQDTVFEILDMGIDIQAIPGNHDLKSNDTSRLSSALETLVRAQSDDGPSFRVHNTLGYVGSFDCNLVMMPWRATTKLLLDDMAQASKKFANPQGWDVIIHAGIDGVVPGLPDHGLSAEQLGKFGFRNVFAGHYHNHKVLGHNVTSIGATTHQSWRDIDSRAGFLLVNNDGTIKWHDTHAPKFIDISGWDETDIRLEAPGNYIRFRGPAMNSKDLDDLRKWLSTLGAAGVQIDVAKASASTRVGTASPTGGRTLDQSVLAFVDASTTLALGIDRDALKRRAADTLAKARALEST